MRYAQGPVCRWFVPAYAVRGTGAEAELLQSEYSRDDGIYEYSRTGRI